jgi:hypothetical protein
MDEIMDVLGMFVRNHTITSSNNPQS